MDIVNIASSRSSLIRAVEKGSEDFSYNLPRGLPSFSKRRAVINVNSGSVSPGQLGTFDLPPHGLWAGCWLKVDVTYTAGDGGSSFNIPLNLGLSLIDYVKLKAGGRELLCETGHSIAYRYAQKDTDVQSTLFSAAGDAAGGKNKTVGGAGAAGNTLFTTANSNPLLIYIPFSCFQHHSTYLDLRHTEPLQVEVAFRNASVLGSGYADDTKPKVTFGTVQLHCMFVNPTDKAYSEMLSKNYASGSKPLSMLLRTVYQEKTDTMDTSGSKVTFTHDMKAAAPVTAVRIHPMLQEINRVGGSDVVPNYSSYVNSKTDSGLETFSLKAAGVPLLETNTIQELLVEQCMETKCDLINGLKILAYSPEIIDPLSDSEAISLRGANSFQNMSSVQLTIVGDGTKKLNLAVECDCAVILQIDPRTGRVSSLYTS